MVLRKVEYGDADAVVTFLTRDHGRVGAFVKGVRRRKNPRFPGATEPFTVVDARFRRRSASAELLSLTVADVVEPHAGLRKDFDRIAWASYAVEVAREFSREGEDSGPLFRILTGHLSSLADRGALAEDQAAFELAVLAVAGFAPRLQGCGICGRLLGSPPAVRWALSARADGFICETCVDSRAAHPPLSAGAAASLRGVAGTIPPDPPIVRFDAPTIREELRGVLGEYIEAVLDKTLKTRSFLTSAGRF